MAEIQPDPIESLSLERRVEGYVLVRIDAMGERSEMRLSESNVLFLSNITQETVHKIVAERSSQSMKANGIAAVVAVPVASIRLNTDIYSSEILLTMFDTFGNRSGFALPFDVAQPFGAGLAARIVEIEVARRKAARF